MNEKQLEKINRYEIRDIIGRGSMGVVYLAYDPVLEREVAIKTIETDLEDKESEFEVFIERFKREAKAAAKLSHQGIITIFDFGFIDEKKPFIVMEYIKGKSLKKYFEENIRFELSVIKDIVIQISKALDYAHKAGIVHRDIKPANIIIQDDFTIKIADFGIAKLPQSELTKTGEIIGTPSYMSPEQITGISADYRADLFSLGVILYQFLTGERPFLGESFGSLSYRIVHEQPLAPKVINPSIPDVYSNITMALLEKDRNKRPSLEKVISELEKTPLNNIDYSSITNNENLHQYTTKEVVLEELSLKDKLLFFIKENNKIITGIILIIIIILLLVFVSINDKRVTKDVSNISEGKGEMLRETKSADNKKERNDKQINDYRIKEIDTVKVDEREAEIVEDKEVIKSKLLDAILLIDNVKHMHTIGSCSGSLIFYDEYIEYRTDTKDYRKWRYDKLRGYELSSMFLIIKTYEKLDYDVVKIANRDFKFKLPKNVENDKIYSILKEKISKKERR